MLRVDLGQLGRESSIDVEATISAEDELWKGTDLGWAGNVSVKLRAAFAGTGEVVARGNVHGILRQDCRRCLQAVEIPVESDLTLVFVTDGSEADEESGAYAVEPAGSELEMAEAVREELILAINPYVVCNPECKGLCSRCGTNLNDGSCGCTENEVDPRWGALRDLKSE